MTAAYVDTSVMVAALTSEAATKRVQAWLAIQPVGGLRISDWVLTEFSAALSVKIRDRKIDAMHRALAQAEFARLCAATMSVLTVERDDFRAAARIADQTALGVRGGDALHLAVAQRNALEVVTLDRGLAAAGAPLGVVTTLL